MPDNRVAQEAINLTLYHWGLHGWVVYTIVGLLLALMAHREGLPLTMKSCFYPLMGDRIFGWPGDLVDILSVIATLFGVCTSLGLGTMQINQGLHLLAPSIPVSTDAQLVIIWAITAVATASVLSGVHETCFSHFRCWLRNPADFRDLLLRRDVPDDHRPLHGQHCLPPKSICSVHRILCPEPSPSQFPQ